MIFPAKFFKGELTEVIIVAAAEQQDYENYIPIEFIQDLFFCWTHKSIGGKFSDGIIVETKYEGFFLELLSLFNEQSINYTNWKVFIFSILKEYSSKLNFRDLKEYKFNNINIDLEFTTEPQFNYDIDLSLMSNSVLETLELPIKEDFNTIEIPPDILQILRWVNDVKSFSGLSKISYKSNKIKMKNYSQVIKIPKHKIKYPNFKFNFIKKEFLIKTLEIIKEDIDTAIFVVDISISASKLKKYPLIYKAILLYYYDIFEEGVILDIYFITHTVVNKIKIKSKEKLLELIKIPLNFKHSYVSIHKVIEYIGNLDENEIVFLTDGKIELNNIRTKSKWNIISSIENTSIRNFSLNSKGKFFKYE